MPQISTRKKKVIPRHAWHGPGGRPGRQARCLRITPLGYRILAELDAGTYQTVEKLRASRAQKA